MAAADAAAIRHGPSIYFIEHWAACGFGTFFSAVAIVFRV
jgi:hypothetical protein